MSWYCSFLIFQPQEIDLVLSICSDADWVIHFTVDPSRRYRFSRDGLGLSTSYRSDSVIACGPLMNGDQYGKLLVFHGDQNEVDNILDLINSSLIVLRAYHEPDNSYVHAFELPTDFKTRQEVFRCIFRTDGFYQQFKYWLEMPAALALAAAAWKDKSVLYAIHKLAKSIRTECVTPDSMHPVHGQVFDKHSESHLEQVGTSTAINLAFSAIQELQLDVKASNAKPRWLDNGAYEWNPAVLTDLQERLRSVGIEDDSIFDWVTRGTPTEVEVHPIRDMLSEYSDGQVVRDVEYSFPDAINACEYIRNFMTAHAFREKTTRLGPYEVCNVQQVARRLVLSILGMWRVWPKDLERRYSQLS